MTLLEKSSYGFPYTCLHGEKVGWEISYGESNVNPDNNEEVEKGARKRSAG